MLIYGRVSSLNHLPFALTEPRYSNFTYLENLLFPEAQRIHGTIHTDIMCTGDGCGCQFYRRKKVQADIRLAQEQIDKFGR